MELLTIILLSIIIIISILNFARGSKKKIDDLEYLISQMQIQLIDNFNKSQVLLREEINRNAKSNREELLSNFQVLSQNIKASLQDFGSLQEKNFKDLVSQFEKFAKDSDENNSSLKNSINLTLNDLIEKNEKVITKLDETISNNLKEIREENTKQLDKMRETVDEKLQKTLNDRINNSFKMVSERLEQVHKGLGEMQTLATGVGDLKKVLSNVKTTGILGEYQLENLLQSMLAPNQYGSQLKVKKNSSKIVDFGILLPGKQEGNKVILPIDSKFPSQKYYELVDAYEIGDQDIILKRKKDLLYTIRFMAKDISEKYIEPPHTTDFAVMFLPIEGLFAEVLRDPKLFDSIQKDYKVILTGPTTLAALLNSLQMGFKTLEIEEKSADINTVLKSVKKEFGKFGDLLEKARKNIDQAGKNVDELIGTRTRAINRQLNHINVEENFESYLDESPPKLIE